MATWTKHEGEWMIRVERGSHSGSRTGSTVEVTTRKGRTTTEILGEAVKGFRVKGGGFVDIYRSAGTVKEKTEAEKTAEHNAKMEEYARRTKQLQEENEAKELEEFLKLTDWAEQNPAEALKLLESLRGQLDWELNNPVSMDTMVEHGKWVKTCASLRREIEIYESALDEQGALF